MKRDNKTSLPPELQVALVEALIGAEQVNWEDSASDIWHSLLVR